MACIDFRFYHGEDAYSDGDVVEDRISEYCKTDSSEFDGIIEEDPEFSVFYHLSDAREALLNWYDFEPCSDVLEIGGGIGALTGLLCEKCGRVVSVELTKRRAECIASRYADKDNLRIMVGDFSGMAFDRKFDYILVIGVLEYQSAISSDPEAHSVFLQKLAPLLKPNGKVLIAIENRFGLKYWCGDFDDHTGTPFGTIHQHNYENRARTFDRASLQYLLNKAGFPYTKFFYPLPDYKLPRVVYSDNYLPRKEMPAGVLPIHYFNLYPFCPLVAEEGKLFHNIVENHVFPFFANSFLVEASLAAENLSKVDFASVNVERKREYRQIVRLNRGQFEKYAAYPEGKRHIEQSFLILQELANRGYPAVEGKMNSGCLEMPRIDFPTAEDLFLEYLGKGERSKALEILDAHYERILGSSDFVSAGELRFPAELQNEPEAVNYGPILKNAYYDMTLSNCFMVNGEPVLYDQEWKFENLPALFVMYRAIKILYDSFSWIDSVLPAETVWEHFHIDEIMRGIFGRLREILFKDVLNKAVCAKFDMLCREDASAVDRNAELLLYGNANPDSIHTEMNQLKQINDEQKIRIFEKDEALKKASADYMKTQAEMEALKAENRELTESLEAMQEELKSYRGIT